MAGRGDGTIYENVMCHIYIYIRPVGCRLPAPPPPPPLKKSLLSRPTVGYIPGISAEFIIYCLTLLSHHLKYFTTPIKGRWVRRDT